MLDIFDEHGAEYLETWRLPPLTWTELQELKAQAGVPAIEGSSPGDGIHKQHIFFNAATLTPAVCLLELPLHVLANAACVLVADDARMIMGCEQCQPAALEPAVTGNMSDEDAMCEGDEEDLDAVD